MVRLLPIIVFGFTTTFCAHTVPGIALQAQSSTQPHGMIWGTPTPWPTQHSVSWPMQIGLDTAEEQIGVSAEGYLGDDCTLLFNLGPLIQTFGTLQVPLPLLVPRSNPCPHY